MNKPVTDKAAPNKPARIGDLIALAPRLRDVLDQETEHLQAMRVQEAMALHADKAELSRLYGGLTRALKADPEGWDAVAPALRAELHDSTQALAESLLANQRAIQIAQAANHRVVRLITDAVARSRPSVGNYGRDAVVPPARSSGPALSIAVDRRA